MFMEKVTNSWLVKDIAGGMQFQDFTRLSNEKKEIKLFYP